MINLYLTSSIYSEADNIIFEELKILIFSIGVAVGAIAAVYVLNEHLDNKYYELYNYHDLDSDEETAVTLEDDEPRLGAPTEFKPRDQKVLVQNRYEKIAKNYNELRQHPVDSDEDEDEPMDNYPIENVRTKSNKEPYVISIEEFSEERENFDKVTVYYYQEDDTLCDDNEEVITDVLRFIGSDALTCFGDESDDENVVYIRNEPMEIDYEVIRLTKSYSETVLGFNHIDERAEMRRPPGYDD